MGQNGGSHMESPAPGLMATPLSMFYAVCREQCLQLPVRNVLYLIKQANQTRTQLFCSQVAAGNGVLFLFFCSCYRCFFSCLSLLLCSSGYTCETFNMFLWILEYDLPDSLFLCVALGNAVMQRPRIMLFLLGKFIRFVLFRSES